MVDGRQWMLGWISWLTGMFSAAPPAERAPESRLFNPVPTPRGQASRYPRSRPSAGAPPVLLAARHRTPGTDGRHQCPCGGSGTAGPAPARRNPGRAAAPPPEPAHADASLVRREHRPPSPDRHHPAGPGADRPAASGGQQPLLPASGSHHRIGGPGGVPAGYRRHPGCHLGDAHASDDGGPQQPRGPVRPPLLALGLGLCPRLGNHRPVAEPGRQRPFHGGPAAGPGLPHPAPRTGAIVPVRPGWA